VVLGAGTHIMCVVDRRWDRDGARAARVGMAQGVRERLDTISCEPILVEEDIVVSWLARAEDPLVATQVKVPLYWARHDCVDDGARWAIRVASSSSSSSSSSGSAAALLAAFGRRRVVTCDGVLGGKNEFVFFSDDDKRDGRVEVQLCACISDAEELFLEDRLEFTLRDTIAIEQDTLWKISHGLSVPIEHVHTHVLQVLDDFPWGRLHPHPSGIPHCIPVDTSNQGSE